MLFRPASVCTWGLPAVWPGRASSGQIRVDGRGLEPLWALQAVPWGSCSVMVTPPQPAGSQQITHHHWPLSPMSGLHSFRHPCLPSPLTHLEKPNPVCICVWGDEERVVPGAERGSA